MRRELHLPWVQPRRDDSLFSGSAIVRAIRSTLARLKSQNRLSDKSILSDHSHLETGRGYPEYIARQQSARFR